MDSERNLHRSAPTTERREQPRRETVDKTVTVIFHSGQSLVGRVVDESLGGIGLEFEQRLPNEPSPNEKLMIIYNGVRLVATLRHLNHTDSGRCRIGVQWSAAGFSKMKRETGSEETSEFFRTVPSGLFIMSQFMENKKFTELGETAQRLQSLASRCGILDLDPAVERLVESIQDGGSRGTVRRSFHSLVKKCVELGRRQEKEAAVVAKTEAPSSDVELVDSLLGSIERTSNEITIQSLAEVLRSLMGSIPPGAIDTVFHRIADAMRATANPETARSLGGTLNAAASRLTVESVDVAFDRITASVDAFEDAKVRKSIQAVLKTLSEKLPNESADRIFEQLVEKIRAAEGDAAESLTSVLHTVGERLPSDAVERAVPLLTDLVIHAGNPSALPALRHLLQLLIDKLPIDHLHGTFHLLVSALDQADDDLKLQCLAQSLSAVSERMPVGEGLFQ